MTMYLNLKAAGGSPRFAPSRVGPHHHTPILSRTRLGPSPRKGKKRGNKCA